MDLKKTFHVASKPLRHTVDAMTTDDNHITAPFAHAFQYEAADLNQFI